MRWSYLFWLVVAGVAVAALFETKHKVQTLEDQLLTTERQIHQERETIEVLRAEWSYLNQPSRIEALAEKYLGLKPMTPQQIVSVDRLPPRPEDFDRVPVALDKLLPPAKPQQLPSVTTVGTGSTSVASAGLPGGKLAITPVSESKR
ncbi:cell division protein FtsL [Tistlia consotensis]|uniref:Cell division protein FtsL n=1 Tax=Tistlia consotensis USBA 355 TaxID=560819 RepID=A0A1Y6CL09_9PROT|nr:cell division protein FtsL [Tistlia consotensis]SMF70996.1 cell division protein FtsL [Tistlia consotensis USBA 355]SNS07098.1 cell division protein FtsL [Tistlia consotensis]